MNFMNLSSDSFSAPLFLKQAKPKADRVGIILKYFTSDLLEIVKELYSVDIELFDYSDDVKLLDEIVKNGL